jgi:hypothetical protein
MPRVLDGYKIGLDPTIFFGEIFLEKKDKKKFHKE